ncbi:hypothetical protein [Tenacibaculum maritimum]|uniref:hypothetical protein n=1 Tax=Tenacibaculum maritimum TaxID=107401 RepID=UPI001E49DD30|nr:hypothetical protein [Tenacibaculum maritimum]MCD9585335.1 hypothetical protein [Tenacibaculum maritimum]MCD9621817.1 hypothetical protein [Tenacibaculum maritimum]MCD9628186.1 hypothetical protein [Tenacibaculum maritimum]MCD9630918.1 hypothetical protein [Tenacibaculum maritimum]MCD9633834.1 hypothetical protein [Tenacibaculum maritimum]
MNTFLKTLAALLFVGMVSCTDTTEETIKTLDGKQELFGVNKGDSTTDLGDGIKEETMEED